MDPRLRGDDGKCRPKGVSWIEATKRCLYFGITCKLSPLSLRQPFEPGPEVFGQNRFGLALVASQFQHRPGNLILRVRRQLAHRFHGLFKQLGHCKIIEAQAFPVESAGMAGPDRPV